MTAQSAIAALRAKQGQASSIDPNFHADTDEAIHNDTVQDVAYYDNDVTIPVTDVHCVDFYLDEGKQADAAATLSAISAYPNRWSCLVINDSTQGYDVDLVADAIDGGGVVKSVKQGSAFLVYKRDDGFGGFEWATAQTRGNVPAVLLPAPFANLNHPDWQRFDAGLYEITAPFQDFVGLPSDYNYFGTTNVTLVVRIIVTQSTYTKTIMPVAPSEAANDANGRESTRIGADWASSTAAPWRVTKFTSDV